MRSYSISAAPQNSFQQFDLFVSVLDLNFTFRPVFGLDGFYFVYQFTIAMHV